MDIRLYSVGTKLDVLWITYDRINAVKLCKHFFFLMLPVASGSAPQVAISSSCHFIVAPSSAVGRFLLQVRQPGTRC